MRLKLFIRLVFILFICLIIWFFIRLGVLYKDNFYFFTAALNILILILTLIKKEFFPQPKFPKFALKINLFKFQKFIGLQKNKNFKHSLFNKSFRENKFFLVIEAITLSLIFSFLLVYKLPSVQKQPVLISFFNSFFLFTVKHKFFFIPVSFLIIIFNFLFFYKLTRKPHFLKNILKSIAIFLTLIIFSIPAAILTVFLFVLFFYNIIIAIAGIAPELFTIYTDKNKIKQVIDRTDENFEIVGITKTASKTFIINYPYLGKKSDYFVKNFIVNYPDFLLLESPIIKRPVYLIKNKIVIKELDKDIFETFAPTLVKKLIKKELSPRYIKDEPVIKIISRQDYLKYRENQINKAIDEIAKNIDEIKKTLNIIAYNIQVSKENITTLQNYIALNTRYRDEEYNECINATWTYYGLYSNYTYRVYSDAYCQSLRDRREQKNIEYQKEIEKNQKNLAYYQSQYNELNEYLNQFENYKAFIEATKNLTPYELGLFEPEKFVKVVLDTIDEKDISNFIETLAHEYLHYTSYVSEERTIPQFFEEGITELLARRVIKNQLNKETDLGYPLVVEVINKMTKKIPIKKFEDIYFTKSSDQLESLLNDKYGKNFYKDTELYFFLILYSPEEEALKFANNIMIRIGEEEITKKDIENSL